MSQSVIESFAKKLSGKNEVEATLQRLDRLTQDGVRMAAAQSLGVVTVVEGTQHLNDCCQYFSECVYSIK